MASLMEQPRLSFMKGWQVTYQGRVLSLRKDATVNREMSCLHHLFSKAFEWEIIEQSPFERGKSLMLKENNERVRFLNDDEIQRLLENSIPHLKDIIICAVNTGMRRGEILNLKWSQIRGGFISLQKG